MLGVVATPRCSDPIDIEVAESTAVTKEVMPARMRRSLAGLSRKGEEAIFFIYLCKHGQRRAGKFCFRRRLNHYLK
jgi:hypothetical protein